MILLDTSGLLAAIDRAQHSHEHAARVLAGATRPLLLSPFVLAELDYMLATRVGEAARTRLLGEVARGAYELAPFDSRDVRAASTIIQRYADLQISLADASIAVLAERYGGRDLLTLDQRHFRVVLAGGRPFRILPADA